MASLATDSWYCRLLCFLEYRCSRVIQLSYFFWKQPPSLTAGSDSDRLDLRFV